MGVEADRTQNLFLSQQVNNQEEASTGKIYTDNLSHFQLFLNKISGNTFKNRDSGDLNIKHAAQKAR